MLIPLAPGARPRRTEGQVLSVSHSPAAYLPLFRSLSGSLWEMSNAKRRKGGGSGEHRFSREESAKMGRREASQEKQVAPTQAGCYHLFFSENTFYFQKTKFHFRMYIFVCVSRGQSNHFKTGGVGPNSSKMTAGCTDITMNAHRKSLTQERRRRIPQA